MWQCLFSWVSETAIALTEVEKDVVESFDENELKNVLIEGYDIKDYDLVIKEILPGSNVSYVAFAKPKHVLTTPVIPDLETLLRQHTGFDIVEINDTGN